MPFIGQQPTTGAFLELDSLTASATANYTLQLNGANYYPESVNNLLVSINGVIQGSSTMSLSGSTLTVGATLSSSDVIDFVRVFGNVGTISTPTDGSVTANKIGTGAVDLTTKVTGVLPVANGGTGVSSGFSYSEGTFDVTIRDATSGGNTGSVTQTNKYIRIGNFVWLQFNLINITTTGMTSSNVLYLTGLPFTPASGSYGVGSVIVNQVNVGADCFGLNLFQNAGQSYASLLQNKDNVGSLSTPVSAYDNGTADVFGTYMIQV
tara:strand:+ start:3852 stop:4646 length:795 start_codon:yes stop_codon:yes gene_type:complete